MKGATRLDMRMNLAGGVSIHAPMKGATKSAKRGDDKL